MKKEKDRRKELEQECKREYEQWGYLYKNGGQDPFWEDGASLNLVRNHIVSYKMEMKELDYYPEVYSRELPPEVDNKYMARADEIREHARASYAEYKRDKNYIWIKKHQNDISIADAKKVCLKNILGYVDGLLIFLLNDDLVGMRRHEYPARYEESFKRCRKEMEQIISEPKPEKIGQMDIFDFIGG